jgi:D-amino-acid dehydrogenase
VRRAGPLLRDLTLASRDLFVDLADRTGNEFGLVREGLLLLLRTERAVEEESRVAVRCRELGMPAEVLDARGVAALEPGLTLDVIGGVHYPLDAHLVPQRFVTTLTRLVAERGAAFAWNAEVRGWRRNGRRVDAAVTTQGAIDADEFVLAAGSWSPGLARGLGLGLSLQPGKGYSLTLETPRQTPRRSLILHEARVAITPMGSALRVGGTMELTGIDLGINPPRVRGILNSLSRYLPAFHPADFSSTTPWCGLRPVTPDGLPYVGRPGALENLTVATGHAMMGMSLAPVTGMLVSEIVSGERPRIDIAALRPDRYR